MEILSVSLKNFKSHSDRHFTFQPGTNAISGENGAGKTSILEAIAWALFNHRGGYKIEDLIRNGAASAQVSVAFISNRDQRTYEVSRCTRTGYTIYDPQLSEKLDYTRIEEDVMPWLRQQFGVSAGTDLADLFANTIGVPQGMFTADFLKSDRERKKTFDTILKVDEYRKAHDELLALSKYSEATVKELDAEIARHDEALAELDSLLEKRQVQHHAIEQAQADLQRSQTERDALHAEQTQLSTVAVELQQLETQLERLTATLQVNANGIDRLNAELRQVEQAVAICTAHRDAYNTFREAEDTYKLLQQQSRVEQGLQQQKRQHEKLLSDRQTQLAALTVQLDQLSEAKTAIEHLEPLVQQQQQLEQAQQALTQQLQTCLSWQQALKVQEKQLGQLRSRQQQIAQEIHRIQALEVSVQRIPILEQQQQRYQQQLSRIAAAAEFEAELRHLLAQVQTQGDRYGQQVMTVSATLRKLQQSVPLWSQVLDAALATMQNGVDWQQSLQTLLQGILADLAEQTSASKLEQQLHAAQTELHRARQHQAEFATLDARSAQQQDFNAEMAEVQTHLAQLKTQLANEPALKQQQMQLAAEIDALNDPRGQTRLLQKQLQQQPKLLKQAQTLYDSVSEVQQAIAAIDAQLDAFATLADDLHTQQALKDQHRDAYEVYLKHRELANTRRERQQQLQTELDQRHTLEQQVRTVAEQVDRLRCTFDPDRFQRVQDTYQQVNSRCVALTARLPDMLKYLEELDQQVTKLEAIRTKRTQAKAALDKKRKIDRFVKFARKAYKDAGPRITERYLHSISREADRLFRELLNRPNVSLDWTRDYEIIVREGAHDRRFVNLSGGEQMCAALAVRLALLKVLADVDIAFFDEPTTNMDRPRREQLAEAIANIKTFRQLFVISHDDTFEKVTENIIVVQREA